MEQFPTPPDAVPFGTETLGILLLLKAFAGGSVALTGIEAIANGVPRSSRRKPKNAADDADGHGHPPCDPLRRP